MSLKMGIVGLPNVGKSTFFNAITNSSVEAANYPFATIDPNIGVVEVKDERLKELAKYFKPEKIIYTTFEFIDIAGLIKGASQGEGLGNKFLATISESDAICQVIRCFENKDITHVDGSVNSIRDVEVINIELIMHDQNLVQKQLQKFGKKLKTKISKLDKDRLAILKKVENYLNNNNLLNQCSFINEELLLLKEFNFLTIKPFIYLANVDESDLIDKNKNQEVKKLRAYAKKQSIEVVELSAEFEYQLSQMDNESKKMFLDEYKIKYFCLDEIILKSYKLLNLETFFTAGPIEVRGWTFSKGSLAPKCAGAIHTDFEKNFIKVEVYKYFDFIKYKTEKIIKENGKIRIEGKKYQIQDGDICYFKINK